MRNAAVVLFSVSFACACSAPVGPIPGGELEGADAPWPNDWSFLDEVENVLLETRPEDPYSVTIWAVRSNGGVYIAAGESDANWVQHINADPSVILSVNGNLYAANASLVTANDESLRVIQAYVAKYEFESEEDFVREDGLLFRLDGR